MNHANKATAQETRIRWWPTFTPPQNTANAALCGLVLHRRSQLSLAEKMPEILSKYKDGLTRNIGKRTAVSLVRIYISYADKEMGKISDQLELVNFQDEAIAFYEYGEALPRSPFTEVTTEELEKWLSGQTRKMPRYLNVTEGDLLKALYHGKPILEEASRFGATEDQILRLVENLEKKIRVILGQSSRKRAKS
jgi:hypothetical protein